MRIIRGNEKTLMINLATLKGIQKAERQKTKLENSGYNLKGTRQIGVHKFKEKWSK